MEVPPQTGVTDVTRVPPKPPPVPEPDDYDEPSRDYDDDLPTDRPLRRPTSASAGVIAPAVVMLAFAALGFLLNLFGAVWAIAGPVQPINPQDPPIIQEFMKGLNGPVASAGQGFFALLSAITIVGSIQMMRQKTWGFALATSIISMINIGNCCCLVGLPVGIWALIVLVNPTVKEGFS
jgi:hypothetical protein